MHFNRKEPHSVFKHREHSKNPRYKYIQYSTSQPLFLSPTQHTFLLNRFPSHYRTRPCSTRSRSETHHTFLPPRIILRCQCYICFPTTFMAHESHTFRSLKSSLGLVVKRITSINCYGMMRSLVRFQQGAILFGISYVACTVRCDCRFGVFLCSGSEVYTLYVLSFVICGNVVLYYVRSWILAVLHGA